MIRPNLSKAQAIQLASKYCISQGYEDFDIEGSLVDDHWCLSVFFSKGPAGARYPLNIQIVDKTGIVNDPPHVSDKTKQRLQAERDANLSEEEVIEIAKNCATSRGLKNFHIPYASFDEGNWDAFVKFDTDDELKDILLYREPYLIQVEDKTGAIRDARFTTTKMREDVQALDRVAELKKQSGKNASSPTKNSKK